MRSTRTALLFVATAVIASAIRPAPSEEDAPPTPEPKIQNCFTPEQDGIKTLVDAIDEAKRVIRIQAEMIASEALADALVRARERRVDIKVLLNRRHVLADDSQAGRLHEAGVAVLVDRSEIESRVNTIIIDLSTLITGTLRFSDAEQKTRSDSLMILTDHRDAAREHTVHMSRRLKDAVPIDRVESEPAVVETAARQDSPDDGDIVYLTRTGSRYHRKDCDHLSKSAVQVTRAEAKSRGKTPCRVCKPDDE